MAMIKISDWMSKPVIRINPADSLLKAVKKMAKHNIGCLVIEDQKGKAHGIVTERDILRKAISLQKDLTSSKVKDIMTKNVKTLPVNSHVLTILRAMEKGRFRDTPITKNGRIVGIITSQDVIDMLSV